MKKEKINGQSLRKFLDLVCDSLEKKNRAEDIKSPVFKSLSKNIKHLNNAEDFNILAVYPIKRIIKTFVSEKYPKNYLAQDIYLNYDFFENNLSNLCTHLYGSACCVDKARALIKFAIQWKETGILPEFDWKQKYTYHYPKTGTMEQWMNFISGLSSLLHGNNKEYLIALFNLQRGIENETNPN